MSQSAGPLRPIFVTTGQQQAMALRTLRYQRRRVRAALISLTAALFLVTAIVCAAQLL